MSNAEENCLQAKTLMARRYGNCLLNEDWLSVYRCIPNDLILKDAEKYGKLRDYRELATEETKQIIRGIDDMPLLWVRLVCVFIWFSKYTAGYIVPKIEKWKLKVNCIRVKAVLYN